MPADGSRLSAEHRRGESIGALNYQRPLLSGQAALLPEEAARRRNRAPLRRTAAVLPGIGRPPEGVLGKGGGDLGRLLLLQGSIGREPASGTGVSCKGAKDHGGRNRG